MTTKVKACKDCKHYSYIERPPPEYQEKHRCYRLGKNLNYISGEYENFYYLNAKRQRNDERCCGPNAIFFEPIIIKEDVFKLAMLIAGVIVSLMIMFFIAFIMI